MLSPDSQCVPSVGCSVAEPTVIEPVVTPRVAGKKEDVVQGDTAPLSAPALTSRFVA